MAGIVIYSRHECHLCEEAKAAIDPIAVRRGIDVEVVDVDADAKLREAFGLEVPVVFVNGRKAFKFRVDSKRLEELLDVGERGGRQPPRRAAEGGESDR